jgi:hypothetical protein
LLHFVVIKSCLNIQQFFIDIWNKTNVLYDNAINFILSTVQLLPPVCASFSCLFLVCYFIPVSFLVLPCPASVLYCHVLFYTPVLYLHCSLIFCSVYVLHQAVFLIHPLSHPLLFPTLSASVSIYSLRSVACFSRSGYSAPTGCTQSYPQVSITIFILTMQFLSSCIVSHGTV